MEEMGVYIPNPYAEATFGEFILLFFQRLWQFFLQKETLTLTSDELQIAVLSSVALSGALIGPFLIFKRMTMLANALSHTILLGIVIVFLFSPDKDIYENLPLFLFSAVVTGLLTTFLAEFFTSTLKLQADASIGLTFTTLFAIGIILVTLLTRNAHIGTEVVMGNVDSLQREDLYWAAAIACLNLLLIVCLFKEYLITTFDNGLAQVIGFSPVFFGYLLMGQVSLTVVSGFRAVGVLMVLALLTAPALTARLLTDHLKRLIVIACSVGILSAFLGVALTRHLLSVYDVTLSTGGMTVSVLSLTFLLIALAKQIYRYYSIKRSVLQKVIEPSQ